MRFEEGRQGEGWGTDWISILGHSRASENVLKNDPYPPPLGFPISARTIFARE